MKNQEKHWLSAPNMGWVTALVIGVFWGLLSVLLSNSSVGEYLDVKLAKPVDFNIRSWLGKNPKVSEKIKVIAIDDRSLSQMDTWVLTAEMWEKFLQGVSFYEPGKIIVDAVLSKIPDPEGKINSVASKIARSRIPFVAGAFVSPASIASRTPLLLDEDRFKLPELTAQSGGGGDAPMTPYVTNFLGYLAYGPQDEIKPAISQIGHLMFPGSDRVPYLLQLKANQVLPHISYFVAERKEVRDGRLYLNDKLVPMDEVGNVFINYIPKDGFIKKSFIDVWTRLGKEKSIEHVFKKDDILIVCPQMFTGNTDFKVTPLGKMAGSYVVAALVNSVLTGQWLKPLSGSWIITIFAAMAGVLLGISFNALAFSLGFLLFTMVWISAAVACFSYLGIITPWLIALLAFSGSAFSVFLEKTRVREKKSRILRYALEGAIGSREVKSAVQRPELVKLDARERIITLMFIDVVGFSIVAETLLPRIAFDNLKRLLQIIGTMVHSYGGVIDKTLGDGLLCYFGYRFDTDRSYPDHAETALKCAIHIQKENLQRNLEAADVGEPIHPLRIGINTASCYLGDLGSHERIDFTVVGNGVNFAKRLEGACDMHSILFGSTTNDLIKGMDLDPSAIVKRFVRIKHHNELVEAYEFDPFHKNPHLRKAALEAFRKCTRLKRINQRWPVQDASMIKLSTNYGEGELINFSHSGLSIKLPVLLVKETVVTIELDAAEGLLKNFLKLHGIEKIQGEVRWGYWQNGKYVHGISLRNLSKDQGNILVQGLCEYAFLSEYDPLQEQELNKVS